MPSPHSSQARWIKDLRTAQGDRGAAERLDQGGPWLAPNPAGGTGEGRWRVAPDRSYCQPPQAVQAQVIIAAAPAGGIGMRAVALARVLLGSGSPVD